MTASVDSVTLRSEAADDAGAVRTVLIEAFGGPSEARLVERLRRDGDIVLALVATEPAEGVIGYVSFVRLQITPPGGAPGIALAPLAVATSHQRRGIGSTLVRAGIHRLTADREQIVFVLGDPAFYRRFGFSLQHARGFASPYQGPHFMALRLAANAPSRGQVCYPAAFEDLG